jgi:hypothetical protein
VAVTVVGTGEPIATDGGAFRIDTAGKTITVHQARAILVGNR